jgi:predicted PurR-regulated permease PerM
MSSLTSANANEFRTRAQYFVFLLVAVVSMFALIWLARAIVLLLFAGVLCAIALRTATAWMYKRFRIPHGVGLIVIGVSLAGVIALGCFLRGPQLADQISQLRVDLPVATRALITQLRSREWARWLIDTLHDSTQSGGGVTLALSHVGGIVLSSVATLAALLIVCMAGLYFAIEPEVYTGGLRSLLSCRYAARADVCMRNVKQQLQWWLLAKFVSMSAVGVMVAVGLWALGTPFWGTLGLITACLTFIPNLGPVLSAIPAALLAFAASPTKGLLTIGLYVAVHFVEGNFITPLAERRIAMLPPGLTLAVQLFLGMVAGWLGIALAAPLAVACVSVASSLLRDEQTEDEVQSPKPNSARLL